MYFEQMIQRNSSFKLEISRFLKQDWITLRKQYKHGEVLYCVESESLPSSASPLFWQIKDKDMNQVSGKESRSALIQELRNQHWKLLQSKKIVNGWEQINFDDIIMDIRRKMACRKNDKRRTYNRLGNMIWKDPREGHSPDFKKY